MHSASRDTGTQASVAKPRAPGRSARDASYARWRAPALGFVGRPLEVSAAVLARERADLVGLL
jgi:hypothetical protein